MLSQDIYEFVTPSDPVTFRAQDDKIAVVAACFVSQQAFVKKFDSNGRTVDFTAPTIPFNQDAADDLEKYLGAPIQDFATNNELLLSECLKSFTYGHIEDRRRHDDAIEAITDPAKLSAYLAKHEDRNRSSMNQIVKRAWQLSDALKAKSTTNE